MDGDSDSNLNIPTSIVACDNVPWDNIWEQNSKQ